MKMLLRSLSLVHLKFSILVSFLACSCQEYYGYQAGEGCFVAGTLIQKGSSVLKIEEVQRGDWVDVYDTEQGKLTRGVVESTREREVQDSLLVTFTDHEVIEVTDEHPVFPIARGAWQAIGELKPDD
ncbi:MAG: hypothetical protein NTX25_03095 [Proteobacteria bacterium]|nr:hypothetical protein [Pseudomonadota bacterium]